MLDDAEDDQACPPQPVKRRFTLAKGVMHELQRRHLTTTEALPRLSSNICQNPELPASEAGSFIMLSALPIVHEIKI